MHLPLIDFRAYKIGNNLLEEMNVPDDAEKATYKYQWKFNKGGEQVVIENAGAYPQAEGEFVGVETQLISEGFKPRIPDFSIYRNGENIAQEILSNENLVLIVAYDLHKTEKEGFTAIKELTDAALKMGYKVIGLTASGDDLKQEITAAYDLKFDFYQSDETVLKTIVRSNPGILILKNATVTQKKHWFDASEIEL